MKSKLIIVLLLMLPSGCISYENSSEKGLTGFITGINKDEKSIIVSSYPVAENVTDTIIKYLIINKSRMSNETGGSIRFNDLKIGDYVDTVQSTNKEDSDPRRIELLELKVINEPVSSAVRKAIEHLNLSVTSNKVIESIEQVDQAWKIIIQSGNRKDTVIVNMETGNITSE